MSSFVTLGNRVSQHTHTTIKHMWVLTDSLPVENHCSRHAKVRQAVKRNFGLFHACEETAFSKLMILK